MRCCGLTNYGRRELILCTVLMLLLAAGAAAAGRALDSRAIGIALAVIPLAVWIWVLWFFRDPQRATPAEPGLFIAPADGCVTDITPLGPQSLLGREGTQIGIFMSVFDVHVNRCPADAVVQRVEHRDGAFLDVREPEAWERNESATIYLQHTHDGKMYDIIIRQIAGLVARRIITDLKPGQEIKRGERIGMIKFGSRMELLVPGELMGQVCVRIGQHVQAGKTVLAKARG